MTIDRMFTWFIMALAVMGLGCGERRDEAQLLPGFGEVKPAPANLGLRFDTIPIPTAYVPLFHDPIPPADGGIAFRLLLRKKRFEGDTAFTGTLSLARENLLTLASRVSPTRYDTLSIGFALPFSFSPHPDGADYSVYARDRSSRFGSDQTFAMENSKGTLLAAYVRKVDQKPLALLQHSDTLLYQVPPSHLPAGGGYVPVTIKVRSRSGPQKYAISDHLVPLGNLFRFSLKGKPYLCYVQSSSYRRVADKGTDAIEGYLLRAVVVSDLGAVGSVPPVKLKVEPH